ncbi:MAG: helix-turn-helix domain-containing protein, partial [Oscillospiraceae bacterium]|nr:helix-turn-helix domain-containing protein [Oscillospiraceae bacterium]
NSSLSGEKLMEFNRRFSKSFYESDIFSIPRGFFPTQSLCKHIFSDDGARLGTAILKMPEEEEGDYQRLPYSQRFFLECFVGLVEKWVHDSPESKNSFRLTSYFVSALLGNADALPVMERQLTLFGWGENCRKQVLVICAPRGSSNFSMRFTRELSGEDLHVFVIPFENRLVVLCDLDRLPGAFFGRLRELLTGSGYCASASLPFTDLKFFDRSYKQAMTVLKYSPQVPGTLYRCQDVAMFVTARTVRDNLSTSLAHPALTFFKNYDAENGTEYYRTLFTYLVCERRNQQTAQALHIHRNTLILRMEKIRDLWPLDLDDANERFFLLFSFYLYGMDDPAGPGLPGYSLSTAGPGLPAS